MSGSPLVPVLDPSLDQIVVQRDGRNLLVADRCPRVPAVEVLSGQFPVAEGLLLVCIGDLTIHLCIPFP